MLPLLFICGLLLADPPLLPTGGTVQQFSSHNKQGENGDAGWHLYDDEHGDAVVFDVIGAGCVRSIWSTDIREGAVFRFYFDGEEAPRYEVPMLDFFQGRHPLFPAPLCSYERRGNWGEKPFAGNCFVPIPFAEGLKITVRGHLEFYHILYQRFPAGTEVETFTGREDRSNLLRAFAPTDEPPWPLGETRNIATHVDALDPGAVMELLAAGEPGCVRRIHLEADGDDALIRDTWLEMRWDEHLLLDVRAPVGYFFSTAVEAADLRTLPLRVERLEGGRARMTTWFPMPFWRNATVSLVNRSATRLGPIQAELDVGPATYAEERSGYFTTVFHQGQTTYGRDWPFCEVAGQGWFVGVVQSMLGEHYCEGDEHFYVDGAVSPQINGTGSEDYYLGCFWPNREYNSPFANCVGDIQEQGGGTFEGSYLVPSCYSRFHLEAPIPFYSHLDARIQHGGESQISSRYGSLAFVYLNRRPSLVQTDFLDVGNAESERAHRYAAPESTPSDEIIACPEGERRFCSVQDSGRLHSSGTIRFRIAIDPENHGVRIRRRLDQSSPRQTAEVRINGTTVGTWYHPDHNEWLRWYDSDFDIHPRYTRDHEYLDVELAVRAGDGRGAFTDFAYQVYCFSS